MTAQAYTSRERAVLSACGCRALALLERPGVPNRESQTTPFDSLSANFGDDNAHETNFVAIDGGSRISHAVVLCSTDDDARG